MEVHFTPELEQKLNDLAAQSDEPAVAGFVDDLTGTREMLDSRYDDIKNGRVKLIPGDEVFARLGENSAAARRPHPPSSLKA